MAFSSQQKYEAAISNYQKAIELAPSTQASLVYCMQGITFTKDGDFEAAISAFEQGLQSDILLSFDITMSGVSNL